MSLCSLSSSPGKLPENELVQMANSMLERRYPDGTDIIKEGAFGDEFYVIKDVRSLCAVSLFAV